MKLGYPRLIGKDRWISIVSLAVGRGFRQCVSIVCALSWVQLLPEFLFDSGARFSFMADSCFQWKRLCSAGDVGIVSPACSANRSTHFGAGCLDVRTLTFCQLMGFLLNHHKLNFLAGEQKETEVMFQAAPFALPKAFNAKQYIREEQIQAQLGKIVKDSGAI